MHRRITFQGDSGAIEALARDLKPVPGLVALAHHPGCSLEPLAKLTQGLVLRKMAVCGQALISLAVGYGVLLAAAFLVAESFAVLGHADVHAVVLKQPVVAQLTRLHAAPLVVSASAAVAG